MTDTIIQIIPEGKVRDYIDGTIRKETPEEYVRQTVEKRLVIEHKYSKEQIAVEF
jgi:putative type I restriction-modification system, M subunit